MTIRDIGWALGGFWMCAALWVFTLWWHDQKSGVGQVKEVPSAMYSFRESYEDSEREKIERQVDRMVETRSQLKATEDIQEAKFIQHWSAVERQLKVLQAELNRTNQALEQHKKEHAVMVASKPGGGRERLSGDYPARIQQRTDSLPAPQLIQLAKEVGFQKVEVTP